MKWQILAVGQKMPDWVNEAVENYRKRMPPNAPLTLTEIRAEKRTGGKTVEQIKALERDRILSGLPAQSILWVLDEHGEQLTTLALTEKLRTAEQNAHSLCFIIGGADGLHDDIKMKAGQLIALSKLTLPHGLARVLLTEQLYRAMSILQHHPYHRE
jgi:23S rRNA (pseudouridine1915-N3)-methyltransferase